MNTVKKGRAGEDKAEKYLKEKGYTVLARNFLSRQGEIDLIVRSPDQSTIIFVEVKSWKSVPAEDLERSIDFRKIKKIRQTSLIYLSSQAGELYQFIRYDVIFIQKNQLHHIEGAF